MIKKSLSQREKLFFILTVMAVFFYFVFQTGIKPLLSKIELIDGKIAKQEVKIKKGIKTIETAKAIEEQYNSYIENFKQTQSNEFVMSSMISTIEKVASELNIQISDLKPKKVKADDFSNQFSVSLTTSSQYLDTLHFLNTLQNSPHLFNVDEIRFDKGNVRRSVGLRTNLVLSKILIP